ncbi:MAG TPA: helix-turn-helix domain-containing protein [Ardenticatenaceae bacterium]|nr:helix-turn-helix domain-containing protein [Ardenticatenaceae bacterium]
MDADASFGRWLRRRRRALDLTQEELAQQVGCSVVTIRKFEADERRPSKQTATRLAECLGIPPTERAAFVTFTRTEAYADPLPAPPQPVEELPPREPTRRPGNLPAPLTSLIGREQDVAAARNLLLRPEVRQLTLVGPPGIGKTRLGLHIASSLRDTFVDGAWFVPLAPVQDPSLVEATIAQTLGV